MARVCVEVYRQKAGAQLGTVGSGNHYVDLHPERAATSDSSTALPNGAALPTAVRQGLTYEAWQTYAVQYGVVGVGIAQAGNVQLRTLPAAFAWLDDPPWYQPRLMGENPATRPDRRLQPDHF